jgi:hypothetical protein
MLERLPDEYLRDLRNACVLAQPLFTEGASRQQLKALIEAAEGAVTPTAAAGSVDAEDAPGASGGWDVQRAPAECGVEPSAARTGAAAV